MCGLAGIVRFHGGEVDPATVRAMTMAIHHRGPDGEGFWFGDGVGFGHRRLAIRDLTETGQQPMADAQGRVIVCFNGEIYNDKYLRRQLTQEFGFEFEGSSDTEVIPYGFLAWGSDIFRRLSGMFAISVYDTRDGTLYLARDGVGIKPLYYSLYRDAGHHHAIAFASEIKALLANPSQPRLLSPGALHVYLANGHC